MISGGVSLFELDCLIVKPLLFFWKSSSARTSNRSEIFGILPMGLVACPLDLDFDRSSLTFNLSLSAYLFWSFLHLTWFSTPSCPSFSDQLINWFDFQVFIDCWLTWELRCWNFCGLVSIPSTKYLDFLGQICARYCPCALI